MTSVVQHRVESSPLEGEDAKAWLCDVKALVFAGWGVNFCAATPLPASPHKGGGTIPSIRIWSWGMTAQLVIAGRRFGSRLFLGSSQYPNQQVMLDSLAASGAEVVTVAIRRISLDSTGENIFDVLAGRYFILPNTAGCFTAKDAVLTAELAREALETDWVKLEVIGDEDTLFPDVEHLLAAASELIKRKFIVLPYCNDDPVTCRKLEDLGCAAIMPLGAPIGSGMGIRNPYNIQIIRESCKVPLIIDAGVGTASDAALAMEMGCDGVLMNSAVARARDSVKMASAMKSAIEAGRLAFEAGRIPRKLYAQGSTPSDGIIAPVEESKRRAGN